MLLKINDKIINTAHIISAHFTAAEGNRPTELLLIFANHRDTTNRTGTIPLRGDEATRVWNALCNEATDVTSDEKSWKTA